MQPRAIFRARSDDVVIEQVTDEVLVYDRRSDTAHCLGDVATVAWHTCHDGAAISEIADALVAGGLAAPGADATQLAEAAVAELAEKGLIESSGGAAGAVNRRAALKKMAGVGAAAVVAPLVVSAAVPKSASAASCVGNGSSGCTGSKHCCSSTPYSCNSGVCCIPSGDSCTGGGVCCSGYYCGSSNKCTCQTSGESCSDSEPCCSGSFCNGGKCQTF